MRLGLLVLALLAGSCADDFVVVNVSEIPDRVSRLVVSSALDGVSAQPEAFEGALSGASSFALRFNRGTRGLLLIGVEAREGACAVAWGGVEAAVGGRTDVTVALRPVTPPDCSGSFQHTRTGCSGYTDCLRTCPDATSCALCDADVLARGLDTFETARACGQGWCIQIASTCRTVNMRLVDALEVPAGSCNECLQNALAGLFKTTCPSPELGDCNPSECVPLYTTCANDLP